MLTNFILKAIFFYIIIQRNVNSWLIKDIFHYKERIIYEIEIYNKFDTCTKDLFILFKLYEKGN